MSNIANEFTCLLLALVAGTSAALAVGGHFVSRLTNNIHVSSPLPLWTAALAVPVALYFRSKHYWLHNIRIHNTQPALVYPHRDPVLGSDWITDMMKAVKAHKILQVWDSLFYTVGSTYWAQNIGTWIVMTNEPENVKALLSSQFEKWEILGVRQKVIQLAVGPRGIFSVNGGEWHEARSMIRPSFVRNQIADMECMDRHVDNFLKRIPRDGGKVDLQELFYMFTMDVATDFMFGYSTETLVNPSPEALEFTKSFDYALLAAASRARLGWIAFLMPDKKLDQSVATCQRFIGRYVEEALREDRVKERPYVFMTELLASGASREYVRDQLLAMILGGRDTSASTMSSLFWTLARRPDVLAKMRAEIARLEGRKPTWEELKELKYLSMVLKEGLKTFPYKEMSTRYNADLINSVEVVGTRVNKHADGHG
ncbi:hypothetical protein G7Z17_g13059 [Cylindrodendrum hubeiense]|uniref:Cytochrome P450 n=1 Tax=Cylindrodendrum hubeiense TaxID=595255 RepID=A0A9P5GX46_9HYPO|nr:hypothetical protein G7Z17_g13059 [Cylindrodendrum hubeiense]